MAMAVRKAQKLFTALTLKKLRCPPSAFSAWFGGFLLF
jgi:hypothetical protein